MTTILIADEDTRTRNLVRLIFTEHMGYKVVATSGGADAVLTAREIAPDIVLVDAFLSNQNGYKVSREIKNDPLLKNTSVILLTSGFAAFDERKVSGAYADDVITKPFEPEEIIKKVGFLLNKPEKGEIKLDPFIQTEEVSKDEGSLSSRIVDKHVAGQREADYSEQFESIPRIFANSLKSFYEISKGHVKNFKIRKLKGQKIFPAAALKARSFKIPTLHLSKRSYLVTLVSLGIILPATMLVVFADMEGLKEKLRPDELPTGAAERNELTPEEARFRTVGRVGKGVKEQGTFEEEKVKASQLKKEKAPEGPEKVEVKEAKKEIPKPGEITEEKLKVSKYIVEKGDNLWRIADRFNTSVKDLKAANDLRGDRLIIGDTLIIPRDKRNQVLKDEAKKGYVKRRVLVQERVRTNEGFFQPHTASEDVEDIKRKYMKGYMEDLKKTRSELGMSDRGILGPQ